MTGAKVMVVEDDLDLRGVLLRGLQEEGFVVVGAGTGAEAFDRMEAAPGFAQMRAQAGLYPFALSGDALTRYIKQAVADYRRQAMQFKLVR